MNMLLAFLLVPATAAMPPPTSATQAYAEVSTYRDRHSDVIWDGAPANADDLDRIVADLHAGLERMRDPTIHDFGEGSITLRFRRFNLLMDLAKIEARRGHEAAAVQALRDLEAIHWSSSMWDVFRDDEHVMRLLDRHPGLHVSEHIAKRFGDGGMFSPAPATAPGDRVAGLARIWSVARDGFVWFDHVPDLDWDRRFADFVNPVAQAPDEAQYYRELMRFIAGLHDGHSNVYVPDRLASRFYARPGLRTQRLDGHVIVTEVATNLPERDGVQVGDEILAIDGVPVERYAEIEVAPFQSSSTPQDLEIRTYRYALLSGPQDRPVQVSVKGRHGISTLTLTRLRTGWQWAGQPPLFEMRPDGIALLRVRELEDDAAVKALEAHIETLRGAKGLVLDLRGNGGGSSEYGYQLLSWLQHTPITTTVSRYREMPSYRSATQHDAFSTDWRDLDATPYTRARPSVFEGPVIMLIDAATFSAAEDTAAAFRQSRRGLILGEPSGGSSGQPYMFRLPGGGFARICVKRDSYADGTTFVGTGVAPDRRVAATPQDIRVGRDRVLEAAFAEVRGGVTSRPVPRH